MISIEYIQTGDERGSQILMHEAHSPRRSLKGMVKRAFAGQKKTVPAKQPSASSSTPNPCSGTLPYESLRKSFPEFHALLDVNNWPTLPPPTNPYGGRKVG